MKIKSTDDEIRDLTYKTEKLDNEKVMKSPYIDNDFQKKEVISLNRKKRWLKIFGIFLRSGSAISTSTMSLINPSIDLVLTSSTALLTYIAILITNDYISKIKKKIYYAKRLNNWY